MRRRWSPWEVDENTELSTQIRHTAESHVSEHIVVRVETLGPRRWYSTVSGIEPWLGSAGWSRSAGRAFEDARKEALAKLEFIRKALERLEPPSEDDEQALAFEREEQRAREAKRAASGPRRRACGGGKRHDKQRRKTCGHDIVAPGSGVICKRCGKRRQR